MQPMAEPSPRIKARIAGIFYLLTFVTGFIALSSEGKYYFEAANYAATAVYVVVTLSPLTFSCPESSVKGRSHCGCSHSASMPWLFVQRSNNQPFIEEENSCEHLCESF